MEKIKNVISHGGTSLFVALFLLNGFGVIHIGVFYVLLPEIVAFIACNGWQAYRLVKEGSKEFLRKNKESKASLRSIKYIGIFYFLPTLVLVLAKAFHLVDCSAIYACLPLIWVVAMCALSVGIVVLFSLLALTILFMIAGITEYSKMLSYLLPALFLLFLGLKLTGLIDWNWFFICLPLIVLFVGTGLIKYIEGKLL